MSITHGALASRLYYRICCIAYCFVVAASSFNGYYQEWHFREAGVAGSRPATSFDAMLDGKAYRPYVYRQLLPMLANWIDSYVSDQTKDRLFAARTDKGLSLGERLSNSPLAKSREYFLRYWIVYGLDFLFAWTAVYAMFLLGTSVGLPATSAALSATMMALLMPFFMNNGGGYFYDYPELAFFALAAWMALECEWWWMVPLVALATWNKESFLLFIPTLYPLLRHHSSRRNAFLGIGVLECTCVAVHLAIRARFQNNPGGAVELHFMQELPFILHPLNVLHLGKVYGILVIHVFNPLTLGLIGWTLWRGWRFLPRPIRRHAQIAAAINIPLYILFCTPGELRDLSFLYVTLLLLLGVNLAKVTAEQPALACQL
jgi:hypothetical protein